MDEKANGFSQPEIETQQSETSSPDYTDQLAQFQVTLDAMKADVSNIKGMLETEKETTVSSTEQITEKSIQNIEQYSLFSLCTLLCIGCILFFLVGSYLSSSFFKRM